MTREQAEALMTALEALILVRRDFANTVGEGHLAKAGRENVIDELMRIFPEPETPKGRAGGDRG